MIRRTFIKAAAAVLIGIARPLELEGEEDMWAKARAMKREDMPVQSFMETWCRNTGVKLSSGDSCYTFINTQIIKGVDCEEAT